MVMLLTKKIENMYAYMKFTPTIKVSNETPSLLSHCCIRLSVCVVGGWDLVHVHLKVKYVFFIVTYFTVSCSCFP